jgi:PAS domain S-box-containing protein
MWRQRLQKKEAVGLLSRDSISDSLNADFQLLFEALPGSYLVLDPELMLVAISDELAAATNINRERDLGRFVFDVFPDDPNNPSGFQTWRSSLTQVLSTLKSDIMPVVKYSVRYSSGDSEGFTEKYWRPANFPVLGADGKLRYIIHRTEEITDLQITSREFEEQKKIIRNTESRMKFALKAAEMGDWELDLLTGKAYRSLKHDQCFGYSESQETWTLDTALRHIHPEDRARVEQAHKNVIAGKGDMNFETRVIWPDESQHWISARARAEHDETGKAVRLAGLVWDITETKRITEAIKENEARFRSLANSIPQLAWMADKDGSLHWYNQRWYDYTGTTFKEMKGWGWKAVHHPDHLEQVTEKYETHIQTGRPWEDTFPLRSKTGEWRWFLSRAMPIQNDQGQIVSWFGTNTDITENLRVERELKENKEIAERANAAKTQFLANMSHEIRTPVGAITGFAEMLNRPGNSESDKHNFSLIIERNSKHLLRLIDDILDLSKVEAGKIAFEDSNFNFSEFLTDFDAVMSLKAAEKGISFILNVNTLIPDQVSGDPLRLKQIILNVAGNAVKFTEKGNVATDLDYKDGVLRIGVTDTGIGITAESIGNLFKAFSQADPSLTRKFGGTGLGLILSKRLANQLGGDVVLASSEPGNGSRFVVTVNLKPSAEAKMVEFIGAPPAEVLITPLPNEEGVLKGTTILLVEDSPDNRTLISIYLKNTGAKLITARDGLEGSRRAMKSLPDIVLMDIQMPLMDGHEATRKLRAAGFSNPIIALTAHAMREERDRCFESGCSDYLTKPLQRDQLIEVISRFTK